MDLKKFTSDAIRTESTIENVEANREVLENLLNAYIGIGTMLDMVKKNVFYGKPFDLTKYTHNLFAAQQSLSDIQEPAEKSYMSNIPIDPASNKEVINVNPRLFHGGVGVATESVEIIEALRDIILGLEVDAVNIGEENGDIAWYQAILMDELGMDWDNVLDTVIAKLKARYPDKFTSEAAINRDTDAERTILESKLEG